MYLKERCKTSTNILMSRPRVSPGRVAFPSPRVPWVGTRRWVWGHNQHTDNPHGPLGPKQRETVFYFDLFDGLDRILRLHSFFLFCLLFFSSLHTARPPPPLPPPTLVIEIVISNDSLELLFVTFFSSRSRPPFIDREGNFTRSKVIPFRSVYSVLWQTGLLLVRV